MTLVSKPCDRMSQDGMDGRLRRCRCLRLDRFFRTGEALILHPGEYVLGSTYELVTLPDDVAARLGVSLCFCQVGLGNLLMRRSRIFLGRRNRPMPRGCRPSYGQDQAALGSGAW